MSWKKIWTQNSAGGHLTLWSRDRAIIVASESARLSIFEALKLLVVWRACLLKCLKVFKWPSAEKCRIRTSNSGSAKLCKKRDIAGALKLTQSKGGNFYLISGWTENELHDKLFLVIQNALTSCFDQAKISAWWTRWYLYPCHWGTGSL